MCVSLHQYYRYMVYGYGGAGKNHRQEREAKRHGQMQQIRADQQARGIPLSAELLLQENDALLLAGNGVSVSETQYSTSSTVHSLCP